MRKSILILILLAAFLLPMAGRAQSPIKFSQLEIDIWPEYDRPEVLVIYHISLPGDVSLPANISLRIPSVSGGPSAVAARQVDGSLFNLSYTTKSEGQWIAVNFTATMPEEQVEYYDSGLSKQSSARHFEYIWPGDYAVDSMTVQVQQPFGANNMKISPNQLGSGIVKPDGLTYYEISEGSVKAEQTFKISIDYTKEDDLLSAQKMQVRSSEPIDNTTKGRVEFLSSMPWSTALIVLAVIAGLLLVGGGLFWYFRNGNQEASRGSQNRRRRSASPEMSDVPIKEGIVYCQQCGNRAGQGDQFCRACGVRLRTE